MLAVCPDFWQKPLVIYWPSVFDKSISAKWSLRMWLSIAPRFVWPNGESPTNFEVGITLMPYLHETHLPEVNVISQ